MQARIPKEIITLSKEDHVASTKQRKSEHNALTEEYILSTEIRLWIAKVY